MILRPSYFPTYRPFFVRSLLLDFVSADPGNFDSFWTIDDAALSTAYASKNIKISGISADTVITAINGFSYRINGGVLTADPGTIDPGDVLQCVVTSSGSYSTAVTGGVVIGGVTCNFVVTTKASQATSGWTDLGYFSDGGYFTD